MQLLLSRGCRRSPMGKRLESYDRVHDPNGAGRGLLAGCERYPAARRARLVDRALDHLRTRAGQWCPPCQG